MTDTGPEQPRHIDDRVRHIGHDDLVAAFGHPAGVADIAALRTHVAQHLRPPVWPLPEWAAAVRGSTAADEIIAQAEPLLGETDVTGAAFGRSARYGFHYLGWLAPTVKAWLLAGDDAYLHAFGRHLSAWVAARDGVHGEWPGLDVIWYSLGTWARCSQLLPALQVVTDSPLADDAWADLVATLVGGARWAHDEHDAFRHGNWQLVSATQLMHIAAVLPTLTEAPDWDRRGRERVDEHLRLDVYPDGGHYERSPGYHSMCLDALQVAAGIDLRYCAGELAAHPRLIAMHRWLTSLAADPGWVPHLQDSGIVWPAVALLRGGYLLDDAELVHRARRWLPAEQVSREAAMLPAWEDAARQRRWLAAASGPVPDVPGRPAMTILPDSGYAVIRSSPEPDAVRTVINYGPHIEHELESHSHRAVLDLVLEGYGRPLLWEAGGPPTYDDEEYLTWFQAGRGHNTVTIDDLEVGDDRQVVLEGIWDIGAVAGFAAHHRGIRYGEGQSQTVRHHRRVIMVREDPVVIMIDDQLDAGSDPHRFALHLHALDPWREGGPLLFDTAGDAAGLRVIELGDPVTTAVTRSQGRARRPDQARRHADYGPLHSLVLQRGQGRFRSLLLPHAQGPSGQSARMDGATIVIEHPRALVADIVTDSSWVRRSSPDTGNQVRWLSGWGICELGADAERWLTTSAPVDATIQVDRDGGLRVRIVTPGRCTVRIRGEATDLRLDDIAIPTPHHDGGQVVVTLPYPGTWTITGVRRG